MSAAKEVARLQGELAAIRTKLARTKGVGSDVEALVIQEMAKLRMIERAEAAVADEEEGARIARHYAKRDQRLARFRAEARADAERAKELAAKLPALADAIGLLSDLEGPVRRFEIRLDTKLPADLYHRAKRIVATLEYSGNLPAEDREARLANLGEWSHLRRDEATMSLAEIDEALSKTSLRGESYDATLCAVLDRRAAARAGEDREAA